MTLRISGPLKCEFCNWDTTGDNEVCTFCADEMFGGHERCQNPNCMQYVKEGFCSEDCEKRSETSHA